MKFNPYLTFAVAAAISPSLYGQDKLEEVIVTSSRVEIPLRQVGTSVTRIDADDIALLGKPSLSDILRNEAGISVTNSGGAGKATSLRIRGEEGYRTLILIDGIEVSDPSGTQVLPQVQHLGASSEIDRIEVLRGPQGFIYGADAGGVINIITRANQEGVDAQINSEGGSYGSSKTGGFVTGGNHSVQGLVSANYSDQTGFNSRESDLTEDEDGYTNTTLHSKIGLSISDTMRGQVVIRSTESDNEFDNCFGASGSTNNCEGEFSQDIGKLSFYYETDLADLSVAYSENKVERSNFAEGAESFSTEGKVEKTEILGRYSFGRFTTIVGGELETEEVNDLGPRDQNALFAELQSELVNNLYVTAGARYDDNDDFGSHTSARVSGAYIIGLNNGSSIKLRTSYGTGFRAPSLSEIAYNAGSFAFGEAADTELKEETSVGYDAGIEFYHDNGTVVALSVFDQEIQDEIFFDLISFSGYLQSDGESESRGAELSVEYPVISSLVVKANYTYNKTQTTDDVQRARRPQNSANLGLSWRTLDNTLTVFTNYRIARNAVNDIFGVGRVELDDYKVLDLSINYLVTENLDVYLRGENLLDEDYQEVTGFNTAGASGYAGVRYSF